jgi:glycosyltransferase involved in cell wall biosynthesis
VRAGRTADDPVRVLHVINSLGAGGAERSLVESLPLVRSAGVEVAVACLTHNAEGFHDEVVGQGIPVHVLRGPAGRPPVLRLRRLIRRLRPDIVHTVIFDADVIGRLAAAGSGALVVSSLVNTSYDDMLAANSQVKPWKLRGTRAIDGLTARWLTDHFHAITVAAKDSGVRNLHIRPDRVTVIPRGRDPLRLGVRSRDRRRAVRDRLGISQDATVVVNVGRQEHQKGQTTLVEAVAELAADRPELVTLIMGRRGQASGVLEGLIAEQGLQDRVRILGFRSDVADVLAASDVFAFPSRYEGLGGALLEAMALGLPAVVTRLPALLEVVEPDRSALVVAPGDPRGLAGAIERLLDEPALRQELGVRGREIFDEQFTLDRAVARTLAMYESVMDRRPARSRAAEG